MKRWVLVTVMVVTVGVVPQTAGAQNQTMSTTAITQPSPPTNTFEIGCEWTVSAEGSWFSGDVYLHLDGTQIANSHFEQFSFYDGRLTRNVAAATNNRTIECFLNSTLGSLYDNAIFLGLPDGETSAFGGWYPQNTTLAQWNQTLTPASGPYGGRTVTERDPGGGGPDFCKQAYPESIYAPFVAITGGSWPVSGSNTWGPDLVGWFSDAVIYYRNRGVAPCSTSFYQNMEITPYGNYFPIYTTNLLRMGMTLTTVWSERDGAYAERIWP